CVTPTGCVSIDLPAGATGPPATAPRPCTNAGSGSSSWWRPSINTPVELSTEVNVPHSWTTRLAGVGSGMGSTAIGSATGVAAARPDPVSEAEGSGAVAGCIPPGRALHDDTTTTNEARAIAFMTRTLL